MFVGRKKEIAVLHETIKSQKFEFGIIYGRRRIGKTALIKHVLSEVDGLYFVATEMNYQYNFDQLSKTVASYFNEPISFQDLDQLLQYISRKGKSKPLLIVIDEFTYMFQSGEGIESIFQNAIDHYFQNTMVTLILSGSQVGMIENVVSYRKPLYGRTTFQLHMKQFDYFDSAKFVPNYSFEDKVRIYSIFGGIPYYLKQVDDLMSIEENVIRLVLDENSMLFEETEIFLKQELRSISAYSMIINAVAAGATKLNQISTKSGINNTGNTVKHLETLMSLGIIEKEFCFGENDRSKKTIYKLKDLYFSFYYKFIFPNKSKLMLMTPKQFYTLYIQKVLDEKHTAFIFEQVAKEFLIRNNKKSTDPFVSLGRYWGNNVELKRQIEVDLIGENSKGLICYECKWTNELFRKTELSNLQVETHFLKPVRFGGFSKNGYTKDVMNDLFDHYILEDLYNPQLEE